MKFLLYIRCFTAKMMMMVLLLASSSCSLQLYYCGGESGIVVASNEGCTSQSKNGIKEKKKCPKQCCKKKTVLVEGLEYTPYLTVAKCPFLVEKSIYSSASLFLDFDSFTTRGLYRLSTNMPLLTKDRVVVFGQFLI